jgi:hypothetical protein
LSSTWRSRTAQPVDPGCSVSEPYVAYSFAVGTGTGPVVVEYFAYIAALLRIVAICG